MYRASAGVLLPTSIIGSLPRPAWHTVQLDLARYTDLPWLPETLSPDDLIPFVDLGSFAPLQAKFLDLVFTYDWGDDRSCCALRTAFGAFTVAPVPEPSTLSLLGVGFIVMARYRWRRGERRR